MLAQIRKRSSRFDAILRIRAEEARMVIRGSVLSCVLIGTLAWAGTAAAQNEASGIVPTFATLPDKIRVGQIVLVTDATGRETKGKVTSVSGTALTLATTRTVVVVAPGRARDDWSGSETFTPGGVTRIRRPGPVWDGAVKGLVTGIGIPLLFGAWREPSILPPLFLFAGGIGGAIGFAIDAAFGPATVYRSDRGATISWVPLIGKGTRGIGMQVAFPRDRRR
jgi:hypothetical protein